MSTEAQETMSDTVERNQEIAYGLAKQTLAESGAIRRVEIAGENAEKLERLKQKSPIAKLNAIANIRKGRANVLSPIVLPNSEANVQGTQMAGQRLLQNSNANLTGLTPSSSNAKLSSEEQIVQFGKLSKEEQGDALDSAVGDYMGFDLGGWTLDRIFTDPFGGPKVFQDQRLGDFQ